MKSLRVFTSFISSSVYKLPAPELLKASIAFSPKSSYINHFLPRTIHTSSVCSRKDDSKTRDRHMLPSSRSRRWEPMKKLEDLHEYTTDPIPLERFSGRGPNGRIWTFRKGGGFKKYMHMIDWDRANGKQLDDSLLVERVLEIKKCQMRSGLIARVAGGERQRWIIATHGMQVGDLINTSNEVTKTAVRANEGDCYPLGSLPLGTLVNCIEKYPGDGAFFARAAGVTATLVRKIGDKVVVRLPSKREVQLSSECKATIGRVSNIDHNKEQLGKAGAKRWLGIRPKSGLWHRKDGRFGRKINPIKPMKVYDERPLPPVDKIRYHPPIGNVKL